MRNPALLLFAFVPLLLPAQINDRPAIGLAQDGKYTLMFDFGIEQYEEGKRADFRFQQWYLMCSYPSDFVGNNRTWCTLDRTVYDRIGVENMGVTVTGHRHTQEDGTLAVKNADWNGGLAPKSETTS